MVRSIVYVAPTEYGDLIIFDKRHPRRFNPGKDKYYLIPPGQTKNPAAWEANSWAASQSREKLGLLDLPVKTYKYNDLLPYYSAMILANTHAKAGEYVLFLVDCTAVDLWEKKMGLDFENNALHALKLVTIKNELAKIYEDAVKEATIFKDLMAVKKLEEKAKTLSASRNVEFDANPYRLLILKNFESVSANKYNAAKVYANLGLVSDVERIALEAKSIYGLINVPFNSARYEDLVDRARAQFALKQFEDLARFCSYHNNLSDEIEFVKKEAEKIAHELEIPVDLDFYAKLQPRSTNTGFDPRSIVAQKLLEIATTCADLGLFAEVDVLKSRALSHLNEEHQRAQYASQFENQLARAKEKALQKITTQIQGAIEKNDAVLYRRYIQDVKKLCAAWGQDYESTEACRIANEYSVEFLSKKTKL